MKKTWKTLFAVLICAALACVLASCGTVPCEHEFGDWETLKTATCGELGEKQRVCSKCGETQTAEIAKLTSHSFGEWAVTTPATCKDAGEEARTCSVCQGTQTRPVAKLTAHTFGAWTATTPATCKDDGVETRTCSVCQETETQPIAKLTTHTYGEWVETTPATCSAAGVETHTCSVCQATETQPIAKLAHTFGEWVETAHASCSAAGSETRTCSVCLTTETQAIAKLDHTFGEAVVVPATFFKDGSSTRTCSVCLGTEVTVLPKTGANVILYEDYGTSSVDVTDTTETVGGVSYGLNGKTNVHAYTVTEDGNTFLKFECGPKSSDSNFNITFSSLGLTDRKLASILVDGKFTFRVRLKKNAGVNAAQMNFRLRGKDKTSDTISVFTIGSSSVSCLGNKIGDLTDEFRDFAIVVDFTTATVTSYLEGEEIGTYGMTIPSASSFAASSDWAGWTANAGYIVNGNGSKNNSDTVTLVTYYDDLTVIGGDAIEALYGTAD